ncbi:uncharacterized protein [Musca autumnalis]|uniref:uncharacterized protein n=1 Tax=Musca autumnalis TaxID=221902 RepID=UPI003CF9E2EB
MYPTICLWAVFSSLVTTSYGSRYEFIMDDVEVFGRCADKPKAKAIQDIVDLSEYKIEFNEGYVTASGQMTLRWEGVEATDRIAGNAELYKFQRGTWQPTMISLTEHNFCVRQFDISTIWYKVWGQYIPKNERKCINNYGHVYHFEPFDVETVTEFTNNMEGRHKIVINMYAFDMKNVKRPNTDVCLEIIGEFIKVK